MKKLIELRKNLKMSQKEIAEKLGVGQTTYAAYETGRNNPDCKMLQKLADFFQVSTDLLLERNYNGINFGKLREYHYNLVTKIENLNETQCEKVSSYIDGMNNK